MSATTRRQCLCCRVTYTPLKRPGATAAEALNIALHCPYCGSGYTLPAPPIRRPQVPEPCDTRS